MKLRIHLRGFFWTLLILPALISCTTLQSEPIPLASFNENYVEVSFFLDRNSEKSYLLSATFTPPEGYHLYSKDIPSMGVDGLGRPTLLELTANSLLKATGELLESVKAQEPDFEPRELFVYPTGAVTLSLPVGLPPDNEWLDDEISVTYMACSASQCKPPVVAKIVPVRIPGAGTLDPQ